MYDQIINDLRFAYDCSAQKRDQTPKSAWKIEERGAFLSRLQMEQKQTLLEIGAGTGIDALFFQDHGLTVTCIDLSPEMVRLCQAKGLTAKVMDFLSLDIPDETFDAVYALNCLLHVPKTDFPDALQAIHKVMKPDGLFYIAVYGGLEHEGIWNKDYHEPKRFFALYTDDQLKTIIGRFFKIEHFKIIKHGTDELHGQRLILRRGIAT